MGQPGPHQGAQRSVILTGGMNVSQSYPCFICEYTYTTTGDDVGGIFLYITGS